MRKRITQQDKKILIYEIHQKWAREHLENLKEAIEFIFINQEPKIQDSHYSKRKEEVLLNLRLLEITTREITVIPNKKKENK